MKISFTLLVLTILSAILIPSCIKNNPNHKAIYVITNHTFNGDWSEFSDSIVRRDDKCITFLDGLKVEQTICGSYSIKKY